jgi:hypothetical protein
MCDASTFACRCWLRGVAIVRLRDCCWSLHFLRYPPRFPVWFLHADLEETPERLQQLPTLGQTDPVVTGTERSPQAFSAPPAAVDDAG